MPGPLDDQVHIGYYSQCAIAKRTDQLDETPLISLSLSCTDRCRSHLISYKFIIEITRAAWAYLAYPTTCPYPTEPDCCRTAAQAGTFWHRWTARSF